MHTLVLYDKARIAIQKAASVDEAKNIRDKAEAMRAYGRQIKDKELERWSFENQNPRRAAIGGDYYCCKIERRPSRQKRGDRIERLSSIRTWHAWG